MNPKILVADDSATMRGIICRQLRAVGCTDLYEASDGDDALRYYEPGKFDLILLDWNMPGKTGREVIEEIRALDSDTVIFLVTTQAEKGRVMAAMQAGVTDYLVKPFTAETLREKMEKHGLQ